MNMVDLIFKKREGGKLSEEEIVFLSTDIQMAPFLIIRHQPF